MIAVTILPEQIGAVGRLWWRPPPQPGGGLGEAFSLGLQHLLQDGAMLRLGGAPKPGGPLLKGLDQAIVETPDNKLAHHALHYAIIK
jgi:hypothetical protein